MADLVKQLIAKPIQLADQVSKAAEEAHSFKQECLELKSKTEKLAALLRQAARAGSDLYERPTRRILDETEQVLDKALSLVAKCRANGLMKRVFTIIPTAAFKKMLAQLENSTVDVSWLLRVSAASDGYLGLPPIAANEPILCLIWEQIATLYTGSLDDRSDAAASLVSLARDNDRYGKLIIEEGGVGPLLKLVKEGKLEGQENAARAIGLLGRDPESVEHMIQAGVCSVFAKILKDAPMKVQAMVAWAVAELASSHPKCQDHFAQNNIIRLLVGHLAFETVQEHSKYTITSQKNMSAIVAIATKNPRLLQKDEHSQVSHPNSNQIQNGGVPDGVNSNLNLSSKPNQSLHNNSLSGSGVNMKGRESEDLATKTLMKSKAAEALWKLAKENSTICKSITESRALLCFAVLLEKGIEEVQFNSAMALMEITAVAEKDAELRRSAFKPTSHAAKAVVDQVLKIIEKEDSDLLIPCVKVMGHLARTFKATETRIIGPLVQLMDETERDGEVYRQAAIALAKFACKDNYLHHDHAKAIISAGGAKHLIQMVYIGEQKVQISGLILLCWIALHVPDSEELAKTEVLPVLEWASKQGFMVQDPSVETLLHEAKGRLELYQSRGTRGFH